MTYEGGGLFTTDDEISWYIVLWSEGCVGS